MTACPKVNADIPPVLISRAVSSPALRKRRNRFVRSWKLARRAIATFVVLLLPAPKADPSDVTRGARRSLSLGIALTIARPMRVEEAQHTHLVSDSRIRNCTITDTRYCRTMMTQATTSRSRAVASIVMLSTYTVSMAIGLRVHAWSKYSMSSTLSSVVANAPPAVMPHKAVTRTE